MSPRAVLYSRVSSAKQVAEGHSLDNQRERLLGEAASRGYEVIEVVVDGAQSGGSLDRPGMARVLELVDAGDVDVVMATKADRLSRSLHDLLGLWRRLEARGVELVTADEVIDTSTPLGMAMAQIRGVFAELEREMIRSRTREGMEAAKASGRWIGRPPIGFTCERGVLAPVPGPDLDRAYWACARYASGATLRDIASELNSMGVPAARGGRWHAASVQRLIRGPRLAGLTVDE